MSHYHRGMRSRRMEVNDYCGRCYYWQRLDSLKGYCQLCDEGRRESSHACPRWLEKIGGKGNGETKQENRCQEKA